MGKMNKEEGGSRRGKPRGEEKEDVKIRHCQEKRRK